jgi:uncharacterized SAM-dependent methyltransferase/transposase
MTYFKNVELADRYNISEATVRNWVKMTREGKLELTLAQEKGRHYVADIPRNMPIIERLIEGNKKYRNSKSVKTVSPRPQFYKHFNQTQIYDIVRNLEIHHEIPRQYNYFDGGADEWDHYIQQLAGEKAPNLLNRTTELMAENQGYLDKRLGKYRRINIVDVGVGNALPVKGTLTHLLSHSMLGRYIAIDVSPEMLRIAERNIKEWFGGRITFEGYQLDITYERFANILAEDYLKRSAEDTVNLVLFLGGTPYNFRNPSDAFRTINESMNPNDLLVYTDKLETESMRPQWFDYNASRPKKFTLAPIHRLVFDLLNIDESFYDVEMGFDKDARQRYARARLKVALTLKFDFEDGERVLELEKGDTILLWRSWQMTSSAAINQFERNGFYVLHASQTEDREYILTVAEVKRS